MPVSRNFRPLSVKPPTICIGRSSTSTCRLSRFGILPRFPSFPASTQCRDQSISEERAWLRWRGGHNGPVRFRRHAGLFCSHSGPVRPPPAVPQQAAPAREALLRPSLQTPLPAVPALLVSTKLLGHRSTRLVHGLRRGSGSHRGSELQPSGILCVTLHEVPL